MLLLLTGPTLGIRPSLDVPFSFGHWPLVFLVGGSAFYAPPELPAPATSSDIWFGSFWGSATPPARPQGEIPPEPAMIVYAYGRGGL